MGCFLTHANVCSFWWFISYFISDTLLYHTKACVTHVQACTTIQSNPLYFVQFCFVSVYFRGSWKYNTVINTDTEQQYSTSTDYYICAMIFAKQFNIECHQQGPEQKQSEISKQWKAALPCYNRFRIRIVFSAPTEQSGMKIDLVQYTRHSTFQSIYYFLPFPHLPG